MASQASKDTAAAKAKQNNNNQAAIDTAAAKAKQSGGDGGTSDRMSQREAASGLNLAGNDTMSGRGGSSASPIGEALGANVSQDGTIARPTSGDPFYTFDREISSEEITDQGVHDQTNDVLPVSQSAFAAIICVNGKPHFASIQGEIGSEIT
jgi:hypothetical protein